MNKRSNALIALAIVSTLLAACGSSGDGDRSNPVTAQPGNGVLQIVVDPNPIVANQVPDGRYQFPFTVVVRETGGARVDVSRVGIDVNAAGLTLYSQSLTREQIAQKGFPTSVNANGELRYSLAPTTSVPNENLFGSVAGDVFVEGTDERGNRVRATARVTVRRA